MFYTFFSADFEQVNAYRVNVNVKGLYCIYRLDWKWLSLTCTFNHSNILCWDTISSIFHYFGFFRFSFVEKLDVFLIFIL